MGAIQSRGIKAVLFDLDGVVTQTAAVHARSWKRLFDEYLSSKGLPPFDIDKDYHLYVDGKPRYDGVRSFLESRSIELSYGDPSDNEDQETICGLGNRKNRLFNEVLSQEGVALYQDAIDCIEQLRSENIKLAVVSSSKNCSRVLQTASIEHLFDAQVDGVEASRLQLRGKPNPDTFLEGARRLGVAAGQTAVIEDAASGVEAGKAGEFAWVVGVNREDAEVLLKGAGADIVVRDLREIV